MSPKTRSIIEGALAEKRLPNTQLDLDDGIWRLQQVQAALAAALDRPIHLETGIQDSLSDAEMTSIPTTWQAISPEVRAQGHFVFEFSLIGRLFTDAFAIRDLEKHNGCTPLLPLQPLIAIVESFGYVYLPPNELMELADGCTDPEKWNSHWYNQFFSYT